MSTELERDITEIKVSMGRIEKTLENYEQHFTQIFNYDKEHEERIRKLEDAYSRAIGYAAALGLASGFIASLIIKLL